MTACQKANSASASPAVDSAKEFVCQEKPSIERGVKKLDSYSTCNQLPAFQRQFGFFSGTMKWFKACGQEIADSNRGPVGWREEGIAAGEDAAARYQPDSPER